MAIFGLCQREKNKGFLASLKIMFAFVFLQLRMKREVLWLEAPLIFQASEMKNGTSV